MPFGFGGAGMQNANGTNQTEGETMKSWFELGKGSFRWDSNSEKRICCFVLIEISEDYDLKFLRTTNLRTVPRYCQCAMNPPSLILRFLAV